MAGLLKKVSFLYLSKLLYKSLVFFQYYYFDLLNLLFLFILRTFFIITHFNSIFKFIIIANIQSKLFIRTNRQLT